MALRTDEGGKGEPALRDVFYSVRLLVNAQTLVRFNQHPSAQAN